MIWYLERIDRLSVHYGEYYNLIIRADSEEEARKLTVEHICGPGYVLESTRKLVESVWLDNTITSCKQLTPEGEKGYITGEYSEG